MVSWGKWIQADENKMRERLLRTLRDEAREEIKEEVSHSDWGALTAPQFERGLAEESDSVVRVGEGHPRAVCHIVLPSCPSATSQLQLHLIHKRTTHTRNSFISVYFHLNQQTDMCPDGHARASQGTGPLRGLAQGGWLCSFDSPIGGN